MPNDRHNTEAPSIHAGARELTDAELEAVAAGKGFTLGEREGPSGWFVPLHSKLRRDSVPRN
jgi:hypothetical protein